MDAAHIEQLLAKLGSERIKRSGNGWVQASCPFAPYSDKHSNRKDAHPSFGVSIKPDTHSGYRCFTCNAKGTLSSLLMRLQHLAQQAGADTAGLSELLVWVQEHDQHIEKEPLTLRERLQAAEYRPRRAVEIAGIRLSEDLAKHVSRAPVTTAEEAPPEPLTEEALQQFMTLGQEARDYLLRERGIAPRMIEECGFLWHPKARRIAIPIRDCMGRLVGISGRAIDPRTKPKFMHSKGFQRDHYLYGEHRLQEGGKGTGIIVEGFFDAIHLWECGYQAVAIMGTYLSRLQIEKLRRFFSDIVVLPDGDAAGYAGAERIRDDLKGRMPVRIAPIPPGRDPDEISALDLAEALGDVSRVTVP